MNVKELTRAQLLQLKADYYEEHHPEGVSYGELSDVDSLVSDEEIVEAYDGVDFVEDDFTSDEPITEDQNPENLNFIKVNIPPNEEAYKNGNGEGCFFIVDEETKAAYDRDETGGGYFGILDNNSLYYKGLEHGERLPIEMRGKKRPVVPLEALSKWEVRTPEEIKRLYEKHLARELPEEDFPNAD